ncbi:MAG: preprotein translocase subunit SecE [Acidobacteriota bacterium]
MGWYRNMVTFLQEVAAELKRTTWPKWPEVRGTTTVVIIAIFIFALFLWAVDLGLGYLYRETIRILR